MRRSALAAVVALLSGALCACSASYTDTDAGGRLRVVATTDVYGSIVRAVAGRTVDLTTFIAGPSQDPHTFSADARDELAIARAAVIVENGGGYDDFADTLRAAVPGHVHGATVLDATTISGRRVGPNFNEHVWYDFATMIGLAHRLDGALAARRPALRAQYARNTARFVARVRALQRRALAVRAAYAGTGVAITEPVPLYLLHDCGLVDRTPRAFSAAVEADTGVAPDVLSRTLALFSGHEVRALVYNAQTVGPETTRVIAAARAAGVAVVPVTETLPAGTTYLSWMSGNLTALGHALAAS